jgi:transcriptional regulator with XRE-family HTH domain
VDFRLLQMRLVSHVRARVRNGEISERSLARFTGISQPHIHNVLKGARLLSAEMADQMMGRLHIDLSDLIDAGEEGGMFRPEPPSCGDCRAVALLDGWIGREYPYPRTAGPDRYPFAAADVERLELPVAARLAPDPLRTPIFAGRCVVLLDCSESARLGGDEESYYALDLAGGGTIGFVRRTGRHFHLWVRHAVSWQCTPLPQGDPLDVIQGRVSLVVRQL